MVGGTKFPPQDSESGPRSHEQSKIKSRVPKAMRVPHTSRTCDVWVFVALHLCAEFVKFGDRRDVPQHFLRLGWFS